jgi:hypothetical protein
MTDIAKKLRDMHALAAGSCDPEFNRALLEVAGEIERLRKALASCESWMDRGAAHVGSCKGWAECTCGLAAVSHEAHVALYEPDQALQELADQAQALE